MHQKQWSFWELKEFKSDIDLLIVGAGFTGLAAAINVKRLHPNWKVVILERDILCEGASTKNAGFACYGTVGEFMDDQAQMGRDLALELILKRRRGLDYLKTLVQPSKMQFHQNGGVELYLKDEGEKWEKAKETIDGLNKDLGLELYQMSSDSHLFKKCLGSIFTPNEGQLNPVALWRELRKQATLLDIIILHGVQVESYESHQKEVQLLSNKGIWKSKQLLFTTNAFGNTRDNLNVIPARNQVYIIENPAFKLDQRSYHQNAGYLYFRGIGNKILLGGARHISHSEEISRELSRNEKIEAFLMDYAKKHFSSKGEWKIVNHWSGIIATGESKEPIIRSTDENVHVCIRFGGMGVALSAYTAKEAVSRFFS